MNIHNREGEKIDYALHDADSDDKLVILAHGVTGDKDREMMVEIAAGLAERGYPTMRVSFAGNGESDGEFGEATITKEVEDLGAVMDQVKAGKKIAYIGYSMGGAVGALAAAKDDRINVLVSLAGMVDTKGFVEREFGEEIPGKGCMWEDENHPLSQAFVTDLMQIGTVIPAVKEHRIPWLLLHGSEDDVVLPSDSETIFKHLKGKKKHVVISGTDHSFAGHWGRVVDEIAAWFEVHF